MITAGSGYKGRAIKGKTQLGETDSGGTLQIAIDMDLKNGNGEPVGQMTTFLFFTEKSATYSFERLRALGWKGTGPDDIRNLDDIYTNEVPCTVEAPQPYKDSAGVQKMGVAKLTIDTGAGTVVLSKPLTADTFAARLKAVMGGGGSSSSTSGNGGGGPVPF
jgi:hypothetical protein